MNPSDANRRYHGIVSATVCVLLAVLSACAAAWAGYFVVVEYLGQERVTFWVALAVAVLVWFLEEMLELTLPFRRVLRRLARWLAARWVESMDPGTTGPATSETSRPPRG